MRKYLYLIPVLFAAVALGQEQEKETPEQLIEKLGHEEYAVREEATRKLAEMGEKAVPALRKALQSEDLEVRIRAGRILRGLDRDAERAEPGQRERAPDRPAATNRGVEIQMADGKVKVRLRTVVDGEEQVKEYEGESLEQLKKDHPELREALGGFNFRFGQGRNPLDRFDMDRFWKDWSRDFDDDFWRDLHKDLERDMERQRRWLERAREQFERSRSRFPQQREEPAGPMLGVRATPPQPVLDAQLLLRGRGLVIEAVEKGSLADRLGLVRFDILLELDGTPIRGFQDVATALAAREEGARMSAKVLRRGETIELETGS